MSDIAIHVEKLSKRYRIGKSVSRTDARPTLVQTLAKPFGYLVSSLREPSPDEIIWALKDISFDVHQGDVVGIIGRNGAGKSTLLKILSRITEPTSGRALVNGRIGSLLEVGTGFHPELTGRENVYLSGAILGMKKAEIDRKFDEIVAFSEIGNFIDTPVKRYSSGMYVRLAFSVAAHLEPEMLLVDEVLAVGDLSFQQKCLNRIKTLTSGGMTVLMVSHNMTAIQSSCSRAIFLSKGQVVAQGETLDVIQTYEKALQHSNGQSEVNLLSDGSNEQAPQSGVAVTGFEMTGEDGIARREFAFGEPVRIRMDLYASERLETPMINLGIRRGDGVVVCNFSNWYDNFKIDYIDGKCTLEGWLPPLRLVPGFYEIHVLVWHWGGGHIAGDVTRSKPLVWSSFGDFRITGNGLNSNDGVFQSPALKWRFSRGEEVTEFTDITPESVQQAFDMK
jgi:lipopolysaccharide transport system ATP-binding protein